jgi:hypothetical protein
MDGDRLGTHDCRPQKNNGHFEWGYELKYIFSSVECGQCKQFEIREVKTKNKRGTK